MSAQPSQRFSNRLGYCLGRGVRFFLTDDNVALRWIKRIILVGFFCALFSHGFMSAMVSILIPMLIVAGIAKLSGAGPTESVEKEIDTKLSEGNYLWSNNSSNSFWHGEDQSQDHFRHLFKDDPHSPENLNDPSFLHETHFNWDKDTDYNSDK